jgi:hypothetical protein
MKGLWLIAGYSFGLAVGLVTGGWAVHSYLSAPEGPPICMDPIQDLGCDTAKLRLYLHAHGACLSTKFEDVWYTESGW